MNYPAYFDSKKTLNLFGLHENLNFLLKLYSIKNLPNVLIFTGNKGSGKSTLINHFLYSVFDEKNYDKVNYKLNSNSPFLNQFQNNIFQNIIYIKGSDFKSVKVEDIRELKSKILQTSVSSKDRFIIFDDIELFNKNSLNALLKIIEEPSKKNFFFLINNKSKPLIETIKSRAVELKIILNENQRLKVINELVDLHELDLSLDPKSSKLSPGNFIKFNFICNEHNISPSDDFLENLSIILNIYKKNKDILFINLIFFIADYYLIDLKHKNLLNEDRFFEIKNHVFENLNNFMLYNLSQNSLIDSLDQKLRNE